MTMATSEARLRDFAAAFCDIAEMKFDETVVVGHDANGSTQNGALVEGAGDSGIVIILAAA